MKDKDVIIKPVVTEKTTRLKEKGVLAFQVHPDANKIEIKKAVKEIFEKEVASVRVINQTGKVKRMGRTEGKRPDYKKAYITLKEGEEPIEYFEELG